MDREPFWDGSAAYFKERTGQGDQYVGVGILELPMGCIAVCEMASTDDDSAALRNDLNQLGHQVSTQLRNLSFSRWLTRLSSRAYLAALVMMLVGLFTLSHTDGTEYTLLAGQVLLVLSMVITLVEALRTARHFTPRNDPTSVLHRLWNSPWLFANGRYGLITAMVVSLTVFRPVSGLVIARVLWFTVLILGVVFLVLGSRHRVIDRIFELLGLRGDTTPAVLRASTMSGSPWTLVRPRDVPENVMRPSGEVTGAVRRGNDTWILISSTPDTNIEAFERWSQAEVRWKTRHGVVSAVSYQAWDMRPESIVEANVGNMSLVLETIEPPNEALAMMYEFIQSLPVEDAKKQIGTTSRADSLISYTQAFLYLQGALAVLAWFVVMSRAYAYLSVFRSDSFLNQMIYLSAAVTLLYAGMNLVGIIRPEVFIESPQELQKNMRSALWKVIVFVGLLVIPIAAVAVNSVSNKLPIIAIFSSLALYCVTYAVLASRLKRKPRR